LHNAHAFLCAQRFLFASHSEKLAISILAPFFVRSVFPFASHSEKLVISIRVPFFVRRVLFFLGLPNGTYQL